MFYNLRDNEPCESYKVNKWIFILFGVGTKGSQLNMLNNLKFSTFIAKNCRPVKSRYHVPAPQNLNSFSSFCSNICDDVKFMQF